MIGALKIESYEDIKDLWKNRIEESTRLEFKGKIGTNNKEIAKDVSAMANAEGGLIIYGLEQDDKGRATFSLGMVKEEGSAERLQQVIGSHIHPPLTVKILPVEAKNEEGKILEDREFLVVKIPQSFYHIHQVETTGRYYIRSNKTIRRMNEVEIERRYEMRFRERAEQESLFEKKEAELRERQNVDAYMFCGSVPSIMYGPSVGVTEELSRKLIFARTGTPRYRNISRFTSSNYPKEGGRFAEDKKQKKYLEIRDDKSMFYFFPLRRQNRPLSSYFFEFVDFLSVANSLYTNLGYDGGIAILLKFVGIEGMIKSKGVDMEDDERMVEKSMDIRIITESVPFNLKESAFRFFEEFWRRLHVDDPLRARREEAKALENWVYLIKQNLTRPS